MILGGGARGSAGGGINATSSNNKMVPPTHVSYHKSVGVSMASIMTDITAEDHFEGDGNRRMGNQRHLAIDISKEPSYDQDYDNTTWKGYIQEIEECQVQDQYFNDEQPAQFSALKSSPTQILEEVEINYSPQRSHEGDVKTINGNDKDNAVVSPESKQWQRRAHGECEGLPVETGNPNDIGTFFKMGNFFNRRKHNHFSSAPSSPPRPLCDDNQRRQKSQPFLTTDEKNSYPCDDNQRRQKSQPVLTTDEKNSYTRMLEEELIRLKLETACAQTQSDQHNMSLNKITEERDSLRSNNAQLSHLNNELSQSNAKQMVQISGLQQHKDILTQKCDTIAIEFCKSQAVLKTLSSESENLKKKSSEQDVVIFYLQESIEKTNKEIDELRIANQQLSTIQDMQHQNDNDNITATAMDWQQKQHYNNTSDSQNTNTSNILTQDNKSISSNVPAHIFQMELKELVMKNQYLQQENKQLKDMIQDCDTTNFKKMPPNTLDLSNSCHTVVSNAIQEDINISQQQQQQLQSPLHHNNNNNNTPLRRPSYERDRSGAFSDNMYSYIAPSTNSYALPTSIE